VAVFCKNAYHLHVTESIPIHLEWTRDIDMDDLQNSESLLWSWLIFRARHRIAATSNKILGAGTNSFNKDIKLLLHTSMELIPTHLGIAELSPNARKFAEQILTGPPSEMITTASILGGLIAQELTKLFTRQYVPSKSTCIFNGLEVGATSLEISLCKSVNS